MKQSVPRRAPGGETVKPYETGTLFVKVRQILESARANAARSVNTAQVIANWRVGREIVEEEQNGRRRAGYAERLLVLLSEQLTAEYGGGYSAQNLWYMRQFYLRYPGLLGEEQILHAVRGEFRDGRTTAEKRPAGYKNVKKSGGNEILHAVRGELGAWRPGTIHPNLSWTHYRTLLKVEREAALPFYEIEAVRQAWSARELERQINSLLYERLAKSRDRKGVLKLAKEGQSPARANDLFKDPTVIEFLGLPESPRLTETDLEQALLDNLRDFLLELGRGFAFVARQQRITVDGDHFYVDLVFYHTVLKCYVLVDLKVGKLTHADLGQIQFYVNYFDRERRTEGDNPTLGLILCSDRNEAVVHYTLGEDQKRKIFASRYQLHLPKEEELREEIRREVRELHAGERASGASRQRKAIRKKKAT